MTSAELHDGFVRLQDGAHTLDFHLRWLRHHCDDDRTAPPAGGPPTATELTLDDHVLRVRWAHDGRVSRFPLGWLREHAYAVDRIAVPRPPALVASLELDGALGPEGVADRVLARIVERGAALVRRETPAPEGETEAWLAALEARALRTVVTDAGRFAELHVDETGADIDLHTDQPFRAEPPRYRLVHALRAADHGGETLLVDARAAFAYLASVDRDAADRLAATPVRFHRTPRRSEREVMAPIVAIRDGHFQIRSEYFTAAPHHLPFEEMEGWYRAHDRFVRILRDPRHQYRFRLRAGDALVYDNHRMLQGRAAFRGPRRVRTAYLDPVHVRRVDDDWDRTG